MTLFQHLTLHFKSPAEFGFFVLGRNEIICHDELFEVQVSVAVSVESSEHVVTEVHAGQTGREEGGKLDNVTVRTDKRSLQG